MFVSIGCLRALSQRDNRPDFVAGNLGPQSQLIQEGIIEPFIRDEALGTNQ